MRAFSTSAFALAGIFLVSSAFGQNLLAGYPSSSASITYGRGADRAVASLPASTDESTDESTAAASAPVVPAAKAAVLPRTMTITGSWPASAGPLTVEILDVMGRPVVRQPRAVVEDDQLTLPVPSLPANTYIVRVLDARGTQLHRETVAYAPRR